MTLRKERLEEIAELARKATYKRCAMHMTNLLAVCDSEVIEDMARQILDSMEQEPLYQVRHGDKWRDLNKAQYDDNVNLGAEGLRIVYAAPQLPQPAVVMPDEMAISDDMNLYQKSFAQGHNAFRAAMLQGKADGALTNEDTKRVGELVMWVKRLAHSLRKANPDSKLQSDAMDYLSRKGLIGVEDILR